MRSTEGTVELKYGHKLYENTKNSQRRGKQLLVANIKKGCYIFRINKQRPVADKKEAYDIIPWLQKWPTEISHFQQVHLDMFAEFTGLARIVLQLIAKALNLNVKEHLLLMDGGWC